MKSPNLLTIYTKTTLHTPVSVKGDDLRVELTLIEQGDWDHSGHQREFYISFVVSKAITDKNNQTSWENIPHGNGDTYLQLTKCSEQQLIRAAIHIWTIYRTLKLCDANETAYEKARISCTKLSHADFPENYMHAEVLPYGYLGKNKV